MSELQKIKQRVIDSDFNLVTAEERAWVTDSQMYSRIIERERDANREAKKTILDFSEKFWHLTFFRENYTQWKKKRTIELKVIAMNLATETNKKLYGQAADETLLNIKVMKQDGNILAKFKDRFQFEGTKGELSTGGGYSTRSYFSTNYSFGHIVTKVSLWDNGARTDYERITNIYKMEGDEFNELLPLEDIKPVNLDSELKKARKYLAFKKQAEEKLSKLKDACNYSLLNTIETNL